MKKLIDIFDYLDPSQFLKDLYEQNKALNPKFTMEKICQEADIKSTGNLASQIQGRVKIAEKAVAKLAKGFGLKKYEKEYFSALVKYHQAKSQEIKATAFKKILQLRKNQTRTLDLSNYEYFSKWYFIAIRELLNFYEFKDNYKELAKKLIPDITPFQAERAIRVLERNGLIAKNPEGIYKQTDVLITSGEWKSLAIANFQQKTLELAKDSFDNVPKEQRSISTVTVSISEETIAKIKEEMKKCRQNILELAKNDPHPDRVLQINLSAFPLTR